MKNKKRVVEGFTLIELIVVVAILGIISAIAIPKVSGSVANSRIKTLQYNISILNSTILQDYALNPGKYVCDVGDKTQVDGDAVINGPITELMSSSNIKGISVHDVFFVDNIGNDGSADLVRIFIDPAYIKLSINDLQKPDGSWISPFVGSCSEVPPHPYFELKLN